MVFQISANMQTTYQFITKDLFALMLMNFLSTDSWKYKVQLFLSHLVSALGECCHFHIKGQLKFALYQLLFVIKSLSNKKNPHH